MKLKSMNYKPLINAFFAILVFFGLTGGVVSAGPDPNATPVPPTVPTGINDPSYQILKTISNPQNTLQLAILTEAANDPDMIFCGGINRSNCFFFINEAAVETAQFLAFDNGSAEKPFGGNSLIIESVRFDHEQLVTFRVGFGDAYFSSSKQFCLQAESEQLDLLKSSSSRYDPETDTTQREVELNLDAFCYSSVYPYKTFFSFIGKPY